MKITRLQRVLKLLTVLQSGRNYRPDELAEILEISRRTIFRDLEVLHKAGIPYFFDDDQGGYKVGRDFYLPPMNLKLTEAMSLLLLAQQVANKSGLPLLGAAQEAAMKIESALPAHIKQHCGSILEKITARFSAKARHEQLDETLSQLQQAIRRRRKVKMRYISFFEKKLISTTLHPYHLHFAQRAWYVIGYSSLHKEIRTFKLGRIQDMELLDKLYILEKPFNIEEYLGDAWAMIPEGKIYKVKLRFSPMVAANVAEVLWHRKQKLIWHEDSSLTFEVTVDGLTEISWWILGYGDQVEVLAPPALRKRIGEITKRTAKKYS